MAELDRLAELGPQLGPRLAPGETLRAAQPIELTNGTDEAFDADRRESLRTNLSQAAPPAAPPKSTGGRLARRLGGAVLDFVSTTSPLKAKAPDLPDASGVGLRGAPDSQAVWLRDVIGRDAKRVLAVTDRRVFVLGDSHGAPARHRALKDGTALPYDVLAELPVAQVAGFRQVSAGLVRGRIEVHFPDGSMLALGALSSARAEELVRAVGLG
jgi:hypothetical protein